MNEGELFAFAGLWGRWKDASGKAGTSVGDCSSGPKTLSPAEAEQFLRAARDTCPEYHPLFLLALRAGLRRGELVAVQWGDIQFGKDEAGENRFIVVQHNYVRREHTTTKSKKSRRVDLSRELRRVLIATSRQTSAEGFPEG